MPRQHRERGVPSPPLAGRSGRPLAGPGLVLAYWFAAFDHALPRSTRSARWQREPTFPLRTLADAVSAAVRSVDVWLLDLVIVGVVLACAALGLRRVRAGYSVYAWASLALPLSYPSRAYRCLPFRDSRW